MSKFKYRERSAETVQQRATQKGGNFDSYLSDKAAFVKVKEGENVFRILPTTWDFDTFGDNWGFEIYVHREIGPNNDVYLCIDEMRKKYPEWDGIPKGKCPICRAARDEEDPELGKKLKAKKEILAYIINRDDEKAGPLIWRLGWQLERDIQIRCQNKKTGAVLAIDHPDTGYDIYFTRDGQGLKTRYTGVDVDREDSPLHESQKKTDAWLDRVQENPIPELLTFYEPDYISDVFDGKRGEGEEQEDDRPKRTSRSRARSESEDEEESEAPKSRRRSRDDEPEEEEDRRGRRRRAQEEPEEEEDDGPEEKPRSRRRAEPEDDDPQGPEEEDDEKPKARSRRPDPDDEEEEAPRKKATQRPDPDEEEEDEPEEKPRSRREQAKKAINRLKSTRG